MLRGILPIIVAFSGLAVPVSLAQTSDITPRQAFTSYITATPVEDLQFKPFVAEYTLSKEKLTISNKEPDVKTSVKPPEIIKTEKVTSDILPFYVDAKDYVKARGAGKQTQIKLVYDVAVASALTDLKLAPETVTVLIGPDYSAVTRKNKTRIFDFKTGRLLTVRPSDSGEVFDNISFYPGLLKNIDTVSAATRKGQVTSIPIGQDKSLDAFWLESSMGWSARRKFSDLDVTRSGQNVTSSYKNLTTLELDLSGPELPSDDHIRSLFGYWLHDLPIHPAILPGLGRPDKAPRSLMVLSYTPKFPNGLKAYWSLKGSETKRAAFPLPPTTQRATATGQTTPLAFAIARAAQGKALPKRPSNSDLRQEIFDKQQQANPFEAWMAAQMLAHRLGGCENDPALLCEDINDLESEASSHEAFEDLLNALELSKSKATQVKGFGALAPYVSDRIAPAFLVKIAGQTRSRIRDKELPADALRAMTAQNLLEEALLKDPYDPEVYLTLAQVYASQGRYTESWDLQDSLRKLPRATKKHAKSINKAEASIKRMVPGFFGPKVP